MDIDRLHAAARTRHWVLTAGELAALGLRPAAVRHAVAVGHLHRIHPSVFAVGRPDLSREGRWRAATLACAGAALSDFSAGASWGIVPAADGPVHVSVPTQAGRLQRRGVVVHRCATLTPATCTWRAGIRVTTLHRTLRDLAARLQPRDLTRALRQAVVVHRLDLHRLAEALRACPANAARERRLLHVVERYVPGTVNPGLEEAVLALCAAGELPLPVTQHQIGVDRVDFAWPDLRLVVEADDRRSHDTLTAFRDDRARDRRLHALGWTVLRFTHAEVTREPGAVTRELEAAIRRAQESTSRRPSDEQSTPAWRRGGQPAATA